MIREEILKKYKVENGHIVSRGKFEHEPMCAPYFYDLWKEGCADEHSRDDLGDYAFFTVTHEHIKQFPELKGIAEIQIMEDNEGIVTLVYGRQL